MFSLYGKCNECNQDNTELRWCNSCNSKRFKSEFDNWTSGDTEIDELIQQTQLKANKCTEIIEWISFNKFEDVKCLAFGTAYKAIWLDGCIEYWDHEKKNWSRLRSQNVCLKSFNTSTNRSAFLKEIKNQLKFQGESTKIYGITKNPSENEYMIVMQYASEGSLRIMLNTKFYYLTWKDKINILYHIAIELFIIHSKGLMQKNLHPGNIVNESFFAYFTDVELCKPVSENDHEKIYGVIPYLAPEILKGEEYTQESDIYAFGMVMFEVFTSYPPYYNIPHDENLVRLICNGHKPEIKCEIPQLLKDIMEKCWDFESCNRPTIEELKIQFEKYYKLENQIKVANKANEKFIQYYPTVTHPQAVYISRHLHFLKHEEDNTQKESKLKGEPELKEKPVINSAVSCDILNNFQFLESVDNIDKFSSEDIYQTDFFSVKATITLGTTATTDLENLLLEQKDAIDNILKSQPVYAVGPNIQQGYSIPCITCYVSKPLEKQVLEDLSALFDHEFEIEVQVVEHTEEDTSSSNDNQSDPLNKSNRINNDLSNGDVEMRDSNGNGNGDVGNGDENDNDGNNDGNDDGNDDEIGNGNADGDGVGDGDGNGGGGGGGKGKEKENEDKFMEVSSAAKVLYEDKFQSFNIDAKLWANVSRDYKFSPPVNTLKFKINLFACRVGQMLNEKCRKLHNFVGYYIDSVEIGVSPLSCTPGDISDMISLKNQYLPQKHFTSVDHSVNHGKTRGLSLNISKNPGATAAYNVSNNKGFKVTTNDWHMEPSGCNTTGVLWPYRFTAQELYKDGENQRNLPSTDIHSGHWYIKDNMKGFSITIKQVLNCKNKSNKFNKFSFGSSVIKCPKVVHTLVITFNNLKEFNRGFAELRKKLHCGSLNPQIKLKRNCNRYANILESDEENDFLVTGFKRKLEDLETEQCLKKKKGD
ncbi:hypothetical protein Glove_86g128 [Diversispora epigaea]|uniref:Protein kinase domain-containing protein n=1 Tax=Diversispora epigaea TaxID=1348612 RepID=A0A397JGE9_9GLOM|nr:hypothetical protein Glove_86g128 [Diversispora epigaea]